MTVPPPDPGPALPASVAVPDPAGPPSPDYPLRFEVSYPAELNRWLPLVKWLLAFPHYVAVAVVAFGAGFVALFAFFAVLITGRWPRWAFDYLVGTARWAYRVAVYVHLMCDRYPPFTLQDVPDHPVRLAVAYPERIDRWRPLVQWLLAIPYLVVAGFLYWLTGVLTIIAFFTVLFTKEIPRGLFELMMPGLRWELRGNAYAYWVVDRYPPWEWG
jgi:hypothetical protein